MVKLPSSLALSLIHARPVVLVEQQVRDERIREILGAVVDRAVQLPDVLEALERVQLSHRHRRRPLPRTIVRDRHPRLDCCERRGKVGVVLAWWVTRKASIPPMRLFGQIRSPMRFRIRSPRSRNRNAPYRRTPIDRGFSPRSSPRSRRPDTPDSGGRRRRAAARGFARRR